MYNLATHFDCTFLISSAEKTRIMYVSFFEGVSLGAAKKINVVAKQSTMTRAEHLPGALFKFPLWFSLAVDVLHVRGCLAEDDTGPDSSESPPSESTTCELPVSSVLLGEYCWSTLLRMILDCLVDLLRRPMTMTVSTSGTTSGSIQVW